MYVWKKGVWIGILIIFKYLKLQKWVLLAYKIVPIYFIKSIYILMLTLTDQSFVAVAVLWTVTWGALKPTDAKPAPRRQRQAEFKVIPVYKARETKPKDNRTKPIADGDVWLLLCPDIGASLFWSVVWLQTFLDDFDRRAELGTSCWEQSVSGPRFAKLTDYLLTCMPRPWSLIPPLREDAALHQFLWMSLRNSNPSSDLYTS